LDANCIAPFDSPEGRDYFAAMKCGIEHVVRNRQVFFTNREVFPKFAQR